MDKHTGRNFFSSTVVSGNAFEIFFRLSANGSSCGNGAWNFIYRLRAGSLFNV